MENQKNIENIDTGVTDPGNMMVSPSTGPVPLKIVQYETSLRGVEPATRQALETEIKNLRDHFDSSVTAYENRAQYIEQLVKTNLELIEVKVNGQIQTLKKDVDALIEENKKKKERGWSLRVLIISSVISLIAGAAITLVVEKLLIK
jgi:cell division protein FtsB